MVQRTRATFVVFVGVNAEEGGSVSTRVHGCHHNAVPSNDDNCQGSLEPVPHWRATADRTMFLSGCYVANLSSDR